MWVEPTPNGKFKACERYKDPLTGKLKKVSVTIDKDTKQTRKTAADVLRGKIENASAIVSDTDLTLEELRSLYIVHQKKSVREQTWLRDERITKTVVDLLGKDTKSDKLSARYICQSLEASGKSNVTLNTYLSQIKRMLKWAYRNEYLADILFLSKIQPYPDKEKKARIEEKYLSSDELLKLMKAMKVERWKLLTHFLALSGLRIGEAIALRNEDVKDVIHICKTIDVNTGKVTENAKTDAGNRDVFVQPELAEVVDQIRSFVRKESFKYGYRSSLFFPGINGHYLNYASFLKYLRENTRTVVGRGLTPHALRHTHVSLLAEQGIPLEVIARRVGHEDSDITRKIYFHVTERLKEKDNQMISQIRII